jgi:hypothetical protein
MSKHLSVFFLGLHTVVIETSLKSSSAPNVIILSGLFINPILCAACVYHFLIHINMVLPQTVYCVSSLIEYSA